MKKLVLGGVFALAVAAVPFSATHATDPIGAIPACVLSLDPTLQYSTVSFHCDPYRDPDTGVYYNAIDIASPAPHDL